MVKLELWFHKGQMNILTLLDLQLIWLCYILYFLYCIQILTPGEGEFATIFFVYISNSFHQAKKYNQ